MAISGLWCLKSGKEPNVLRLIIESMTGEPVQQQECLPVLVSHGTVKAT